MFPLYNILKTYSSFGWIFIHIFTFNYISIVDNFLASPKGQRHGLLKESKSKQYTNPIKEGGFDVLTSLLLQIAWVIIIARSGYMVITMLNKRNKPWFDILFYLSIVIVSLGFLF